MNYVTPVSIYGLMNKNCFINPDSPSRSFWKTHAQTKLTKCVSPLDIATFSSNHPEIKQISFMYLDAPICSIKGETSMDQIESVIDSSFLESSITRPKHRDLFESIQKYKKAINVITEPDLVKSRLDEIIAMIEAWRYSQQGGMKYGWVEHAGIDKACIKKYVEDKKFRDEVNFYLFIDSASNKVVGYSMAEKNLYKNDQGIPEMVYLVRKCLTEGRRNITEYVDWWTFNETMKKNGLDKLIVNWGCSSGGVHWYKTHKWPVYRLEKKWFATWKKDSRISLYG